MITAVLRRCRGQSFARRSYCKQPGLSRPCSYWAVLGSKGHVSGIRVILFLNANSHFIRRFTAQTALIAFWAPKSSNTTTFTLYLTHFDTEISTGASAGTPTFIPMTICLLTLLFADITKTQSFFCRLKVNPVDRNRIIYRASSR